MAHITHCLWFDNNAEEAANFYVSIFKNSRIKQVTRYPQSAEKVSGMKAGTVMTVIFELDGKEHMGLNGGPLFPHTEAFSFVAHCEDQAEIDHLWDKLVAGGKPSQCGWLTDKFGISWQIVPKQLAELTKDPQAAERVMAAVLKMVKLDLGVLQRAAKG